MTLKHRLTKKGHIPCFKRNWGHGVLDKMEWAQFPLSLPFHTLSYLQHLTPELDWNRWSNCKNPPKGGWKHDEESQDLRENLAVRTLWCFLCSQPPPQSSPGARAEPKDLELPMALMENVPRKSNSLQPGGGDVMIIHMQYDQKKTLKKL